MGDHSSVEVDAVLSVLYCIATNTKKIPEAEKRRGRPYYTLFYTEDDLIFTLNHD